MTCIIISQFLDLDPNPSSADLRWLESNSGLQSSCVGSVILCSGGLEGRLCRLDMIQKMLMSWITFFVGGNAFKDEENRTTYRKSDKRWISNLNKWGELFSPPTSGVRCCGNCRSFCRIEAVNLHPVVETHMQPGERHAPDWKTLFLCKTILVFRVACGPLPGCIDPGARPPPT